MVSPEMHIYIIEWDVWSILMYGLRCSMSLSTNCVSISIGICVVFIVRLVLGDNSISLLLLEVIVEVTERVQRHFVMLTQVSMHLIECNPECMSGFM